MILQRETEENNASALQEAEADIDFEEAFLEEDDSTFEMEEKDKDFLTLLIQLKPQERQAIYSQIEEIARNHQSYEEPEMENVVWLRRGW